MQGCGECNLQETQLRDPSTRIATLSEALHAGGPAGRELPSSATRRARSWSTQHIALVAALSASASCSVLSTVWAACARSHHCTCLHLHCWQDCITFQKGSMTIVCSSADEMLSSAHVVKLILLLIPRLCCRRLMIMCITTYAGLGMAPSVACYMKTFPPALACFALLCSLGNVSGILTLAQSSLPNASVSCTVMEEPAASAGPNCEETTAPCAGLGATVDVPAGSCAA